MLGVLLLLGATQTQAGNAPPAMITPGQFNVSPTGAFTYTIPIAVPPGTGGMVPALSLDYSSQNGDGLVGLGWTISGLPSITRCPQTIAQDGTHGSVNFGANDEYCLEGQRLVPLGATGSSTLCTNGTEYRTEIDGFSRIVSCGTAGSGPLYFKAWTKSGQVMEFGSNSGFRVFPVKADGSGLMTSIRLWPVNKISDTVGNYLTVTYDNGAPDNVNGQVYPTEIDYTANDGQGLVAYNSVRFVYAYKDGGAIVPMYQAGSVLETTRILTEIDTCTNVGSTCAYASRYYVNYNTAANNTGFVTQGDQHDEVTQIQQCDNGGNCLAPTKFTWQGSRDKLTMVRYQTGYLTPNTTFQGDYTAEIIPGDFNGDGILDLSPSNTTNGSCGFWYGGGDGQSFTDSGINPTFHEWEHDESGWFEVPSSICAGNKTIDPLDFDGDGLTDFSIVHHQSDGSMARFFFHNTGGGFPAGLQNFPTGDDRFGDFNGDGRSDIFVNTSSAYTEQSNGDGTWTGSGSYTGNGSLGRAVIPPDFDGNGCGDVMYLNTQQIVMFCNAAVSTIPFPTGSGWNGSTGWTIALGDFNGDGKTDVFATKYGTTGVKAQLWLSTGTGFTGPTLIDGTNVVSNDWGRYAIYTGDFNGDGKTDLMLVADGTGAAPGHYSLTSHKLWLSTGTGFVQATNPGGGVVGIPYTNSSGDYSQGHANIRPVIADWNNDGASDVWMEKPSGDEQYYFTYTPEVIKTVTNGIGITTTVTYDRLNKNGALYAKSTDASGCTGPAPTTVPNPPVSCPLNIDGPLYVVKQVTSGDGIGGNYTSTYAYAGAKADLFGRGFLGFTSVAITDSQTNIVQTTTYHTDFPYVGLVASQTKVCPHPTCNGTQDITLSSTTNTYDDVQHGLGSNGFYFAVHLRTSTTQGNDIDSGITALPSVETDYDTYDSYGNPKYVTVKTTPPGGSAPDVIKKTTNYYTNDTTNWFLGRLTEVIGDNTFGASENIHRSDFVYDPNTGLLTQEIVEPSFPGTHEMTTTYQYDGFGNKQFVTVAGSETSNAPSCTTETDYDTKGRFPVTVKNCLNESETWGTATVPAYEARFGLPKSHKGPNGLITSWAYDGFGRKTLETRPDGTQTGIGYTYCNNVNGGGDLTCPTHGAFLATVTVTGTDGSTIAPTTRSYYDALSRAQAADVKGFDGSWIRTLTLYDSFGRVSQTSRPYFLVGGSPVYTTFTYDAIGRAIKALQPDNGYTATAYAGLTTTVTVRLIRPSGSWATHVSTTVKNDIGQPASVQDALTNTTTYGYNGDGKLTTTTDPLGNTITNKYNRRGLKYQSIDPDMGTWNYSYDTLGRLTSQTDAKNQTTTIVYDPLGRMVERDEPDMTSTWTYGTTSNQTTYPHSVGKLVVAGCTGTACPSGGYTRTHLYDSLGRQYKMTIGIGSEVVHYSYTTYDAVSGKIATERSFSGYVVDYAYNGYGYLSQIIDDANPTFVIWQANARDAELHLIRASADNGVLSSSWSFDANSGALDTVCASNDTTPLHCDGNVANLGYDWDTAGNLVDRTDTHMQGWQQESFCYDGLNRVIQYNFGTSCVGTGRTLVQYDATGNITSKTGIGTYSYNPSGAGSVQPHAVSSITGTVHGVPNPGYAYDANGNMTSGAGRTVTWTSFNMAGSFTGVLALTYDPEHARVRQCVPDCSNSTKNTTYLNDGVTGAMAERYWVQGTGTTWRTYIVADGKLVAERIVDPTSTVHMRYFVLDHLGSISVITDENGAVLNDGLGNETGRLSYDPWGRMRNLDGTADTSCLLPAQSATTRGYTSQEEMPTVCLINYNARIYDPEIGRFISADPMVEAPYNPQDLNRYTYVGNNPLAFIDPSGLCFLGCFWKTGWFAAIVAIAIAVFAPELIGPWGSLSGLLGAAAAGNLGAIALVVGMSAITGAITAGLSGGNILRGLLFGALSGALLAGVGLPLGAELGQVIGTYAGNFVAQGLVGGLSSIAQGGHFFSGFLAAGIGSLGGSLSGDHFDFGRMLVSAAVGGAAAILGGDKFENGAIAAAFAYGIGEATRPAEQEDTIGCGGLTCVGAAVTERVVVTAPRTYYAGLDAEATILFGIELYVGLYYSKDLLNQGKNPFGMYYGIGWRYGLNAGASIQGGYTDHQFGGWSKPTNFGVGRIALSFPGDAPPSADLSVEKAFGPGIALGASGGFNYTGTVPINLPDSYHGIPLGPIPVGGPTYP